MKKEFFVERQRRCYCQMALSVGLYIKLHRIAFSSIRPSVVQCANPKTVLHTSHLLHTIPKQLRVCEGIVAAMNTMRHRYRPLVVTQRTLQGALHP